MGLKCKTEIKVTYTCPFYEKEVTIDVGTEGLMHTGLSSMYDDVDDGYELSTTVTCPHCKQSHSLDIIKDKPFGAIW